MARKQKRLWPASKSQVNIHPHIKTMSIPTHTQKTLICGAHTKTKSISMPRHKAQVNFENHKTRANSVPNSETKSILSTHTETKLVYPPTRNESFRPANKKQLKYDSHSKMKGISMPRHIHQANFVAPTHKLSQFRPLTQKVNSLPYNE